MSELKLAAIDASPASIDLFRRFYEEIYVKQFPDPNERESWENMVDYLRKRESGWYGRNDYHILLLLDGLQPVAGAIADYLAEPNSGVIEFLTVSPGRRESGLGFRLLTAIEVSLAQSSKRLTGRHLEYIVAEMNDPLRTDPATDNMDPVTRALIWDRWGYGVLDFPYIQPALSSGQEAVKTLCLIAKQLGAEPDGIMTAERLRMIIHEYIRWAMRIPDPATSIEYREMAAWLEGRNSVAIRSLVTYAQAASARNRV